MKKALATLALAFTLTACGQQPVEPVWAIDQCLRVQLFQQCMASLPAGPVSTQYNDWDEVVGQCNDVSRVQAARLTTTVKLECRG